MVVNSVGRGRLAPACRIGVKSSLGWSRPLLMPVIARLRQINRRIVRRECAGTARHRVSAFGLPDSDDIVKIKNYTIDHVSDARHNADFI